MDEDEADTPPFWLQPSGGPRRSRRDSSALLLLLFLPASVAFVIFAVPPFLSLTSQIFRPRSVKKSWDYLNLVLVLFAIVCGFLGSSNSGGDGGSAGSYPTSDSRKSSSSSSSNPGTPYKWHDSYDRRNSEGSEYGSSGSSSGRMRTSSLYPDLRAQYSPWDYGEGRRRLYDDTHLVAGRGFGTKPVYSRRRRNGEVEDEEEKKFETKRVVAEDSGDRNAAVEEMEVSVTPPPRARATGNDRKPRRRYETVAHTAKDEVKKPPAVPPAPPPPLPPPKPMCSPDGGKKREVEREEGERELWAETEGRRESKWERDGVNGETGH